MTATEPKEPRRDELPIRVKLARLEGTSRELTLSVGPTGEFDSWRKRIEFPDARDFPLDLRNALRAWLDDAERTAR